MRLFFSDIMAGRPSSFSQEIAEAICERLASGESLNSMCKDDNLPSITTVMNWLAKGENSNDLVYKEFLANYVRAREAQADVIFDECLDIIDAAGVENISVAKERVNTRMRMAGKLKPKKYGDRQILAGDAENPVAMTFTLDLGGSADESD